MKMGHRISNYGTMMYKNKENSDSDENVSLANVFPAIYSSAVQIKNGYTQLITEQNYKKQISSCSSISSSGSTTSSNSGMFWGQFSRVTKHDEDKSILSKLKRCLVKKEKSKQTMKVTTSRIPTNPEGLYCVIDDFLSTYSDGSEDSLEEASEEYGEVADSVEKDIIENDEYTEVLGARHYQNLADMNNYDKIIENNLKEENYGSYIEYIDSSFYASISLEEYESIVD